MDIYDTIKELKETGTAGTDYCDEDLGELIDDYSYDIVRGLIAKLAGGSELLLKQKGEIIPNSGAALEFGENLKLLLQHERLTFDGTFKVKGLSTIKEEDLQDILDATVQVCAHGLKAQNISMWVLGNIAHILEDHNGDIGDLVKTTDYALNTIEAAKRTFKFFEEKRYTCSFSHHKEVAHMRTIDIPTKHQLIQRAEQDGWSIATMRRVGKGVKGHYKEHGQPDQGAFEEIINTALSDDGKAPTGKLYFSLNLSTGTHELTNTKPEGTGTDCFVFEVSRVLQTPESL